MISRLFRFHGQGSLNYAYSKGATVREPLMALRYAPNNRIKRYRAAVVVSRKVSKSAVVRNRIRRRVYAIVREELPASTVPHDLIFTVFNDTAARLDAESLRQTVVNLLTKASLR